MKKIRINDVAKVAGVSIATVSRALTKSSLVKPATLLHIQKVAKKLGYVTNGGARSLSSKKSWTIGAVIPSLENAIFANTAFALQKMLRENGYMLLVSCSEYDLDVEVDLVRGLIERGIDGLILVGTRHKPKTIELIKRFKVPHVFTWAFERSGKLPIVGFDHSEATALVTRYLLDLGHRRFGVISTITRNNQNAIDRMLGVVTTLKLAGIELPPEFIVEEPFSYSKGADGFRQIFLNKRNPTAVICLNDVLAIGAISEARNMGLKVPEDVSITGCEDLEIAAMINPRLTTVKYPTAKMGSIAAQYIISQLKNEKPILQSIFPTELVVRESSGPPK